MSRPVAKPWGKPRLKRKPFPFSFGWHGIHVLCGYFCEAYYREHINHTENHFHRVVLWRLWPIWGKAFEGRNVHGTSSPKRAEQAEKKQIPGVRTATVTYSWLCVWWRRRRWTLWGRTVTGWTCRRSGSSSFPRSSPPRGSDDRTALRRNQETLGLVIR